MTISRAALVAGAQVRGQQQVEAHRRRELGRRTEPAPRVVERGAQGLDGAGDVGGAGQLVDRPQPGRAGDGVAQGVGVGAQLLALVRPGVGDGRHQLDQVGRREVRAAVERVAVGRQEDRHRPPAPAGHRLHGVHVHGVDVGSLLAVDLDVDEPGVHVGGDGGVLERLVGHHVAPVARRVPDREQHGHVAAAGLVERLLPPGEPVHGVVTVLTEVWRRLAGEPVHGGDATDPHRFSRRRGPRSRHLG